MSIEDSCGIYTVVQSVPFATALALCEAIVRYVETKRCRMCLYGDILSEQENWLHHKEADCKILSQIPHENESKVDTVV